MDSDRKSRRSRRSGTPRRLRLVFSIAAAILVFAFGIVLIVKGGAESGLEAIPTVDPVAAEDDEQLDDDSDRSSGNGERKSVSSTASEIPTVSESALSVPDTFEAEEERGVYEGNWHTDKSLRARFGCKEVVVSGEKSYVAGELLVTTSVEVSEERIYEIADELGGAVSEIKPYDMLSVKVATIYFQDNADIEKIAERASKLQDVDSAEPDFSGRISASERNVEKSTYPTHLPIVSKRMRGWE